MSRQERDTITTATTERLMLARCAQSLRAAGATHRRIAATLGISSSYASSLVNDPTGEKERRRKLRYRGTCERCGAATDGSNGRARAPRLCGRCTRARAHAERAWTRVAIVDAIRRFAGEHGRQPASTEWFTSREPGYPSVGIVRREFGTWADAIEAAGFPRPRVGGVRIATKNLVCEECGQTFTHTVRTVRFCAACRERRRRRGRARKPPRELACLECGHAFTTRPGRGQHRRQRCYVCRPQAPPGRSPSTLGRARLAGLKAEGA